MDVRGSRSALYQIIDRMVVRAPLLPVQRYLALSDAGDADSRDPLVRAAISVASPALADALDREPHDRKAGRALRSAVLRYLIRMSTRPTPFGLFASVGIGWWGERTDLRVAPGARPTRARPDTGWLIRLVLDLEQNAALRGQFSLVTNTCAFERDGRLYLSERASCGHAGQPDVSLKATHLVRSALEFARKPVSHTELVARLVASATSTTRDSTHAATTERAVALIGQLCAQDLLLADIRPPLTADPTDHIIKRLADVPGQRDLTETLAAAKDEAHVLGQYIAQPIVTDGADAMAGLAALRRRLRSVTVAPGPSFNADGEADAVQVDSVLPLLGTAVSRAVAAEACRAVDLLLRLHPAPGGPAHLAGYRKAVLARYGELHCVPLLELLDPRFGLGPPSIEHARKAQPDQTAARRRSTCLLELAYAAMASGHREIALDDSALDQLALWSPDPAALPASLELSAFVAAASPEAIDRGQFRLVVGPNVGAQAAGRGMARFAGLLGDAGPDLLREIADAERRRRGSGVVAELVYLPLKLRSANVVVRPAVRDYEIPIGVSPGVPPDRVIAPSELAVFVRDGRLRLWWSARGAEVTVTAGHMLNPSGAPALSRFLHEVGLDGMTSLTGFDWGPAAGLPMLPRVCVGRVVLRSAQWRLSRSRARQALRVDDEAGFRAGLTDWRGTWRVPRHVYLALGDNRLLIDLDDPAQAGQLRRELRGARGNDVVLQEALPGPDDAWLPGRTGSYFSELVIPLIRAVPDQPNRPGESPRPARPASVAVRSEQVRAPGSDWLFLTLYGPKLRLDQFISGPLRHLTDELGASGTVDRWFFLRYTDPDPHVRLRLHGAPQVLMARVLPRAASWSAQLIGAGALSRVGIEPYHRELERYGGPAATDLAEVIFAADSVACASLLAIYGESVPELPDRVDLAVLCLDDLLAGLGLDATARLDWCAATAPPGRVSSVAYRSRGRRLRALLASDESALGRWHAPVTAVLAARRAALAPPATALAALCSANPSMPSLFTLARSFTHMCCNRLGVDPATEPLIFGLLRRTLASLAVAPHSAKNTIR